MGSCLVRLVAMFPDFSSFFWPVLDPLRGLTSAFVTPACPRLITRKIGASLIKSLKEMRRDYIAVQLGRVSPSGRTRTSSVVLSTDLIEMVLANHFVSLQPTSSVYLRGCFPQSTTTAFRKLPGSGLCTQHLLKNKVCILRKPTHRDSLTRDNNFTFCAS